MKPARETAHGLCNDAPNIPGLPACFGGNDGPHSAYCDRLTAAIEQDRTVVVSALQAIFRNDTTYYEHHQVRRWDGRAPREAGEDGTRWLEPREIAANVLRRLGAKVPDSFEEMRERVAAKTEAGEAQS